MTTVMLLAGLFVAVLAVSWLAVFMHDRRKPRPKSPNVFPPGSKRWRR